ncbi:hypothetical protein [Carbonactinospora thermoautotrophica]|nr:hypothetical protein [Carbonactinospora thermoautotrophica]
MLIDGVRLGRLVVEYGCGVRTGEIIELKEIDETFFLYQSSLFEDL